MNARRGRAAAWLTGFIILMLAAAALALAALTHVPLATVRAYVQASTHDEYTYLFNAANWPLMARRAHAAAAALLALATLLLAVRRCAIPSFAHAGFALRVACCATISRLRAPWTIERWTLAGIALAGALIRLRYLNIPFRFDESFTILHFARHALWASISFYPMPNNHLFNSLLGHLILRHFSSRPWALRLPVFLCGAGTPLLAGIAFGRLYRPGAGLLAAAATAASTLLIDYSTQMRGYAFIVLACVLMLLLSLRLVQRPRRAAAEAASYGLVGAIGFWANPTMLYPVALLGAWLVLSGLLMRSPRTRRRFFSIVLAAHGLMGLLIFTFYSPGLIVSGVGPFIANRWVSPLASTQFAYELGQLGLRLWGGTWNRDIPAIVQCILAAGLAVGTIFHHSISKFRVPPLICVPIVALIVFVQRVIPFDRVFVFLIPLYFGVAMAGLYAGVSLVARHLRLRSRALCPASALLCAALMSIPVLRGNWVEKHDPTSVPEIESVIPFFEQRLGVNARLLVCGFDWTPLKYYLLIHRFDFGHDLIYSMDGGKPNYDHVYLIVFNPPIAELNPDLTSQLFITDKSAIFQTNYEKPAAVLERPAFTVYDLKRRAGVR